MDWGYPLLLFAQLLVAIVMFQSSKWETAERPVGSEPTADAIAGCKYRPQKPADVEFPGIDRQGDDRITGNNKDLVHVNADQIDSQYTMK